jgi:hypothetical protein
VNANNGLRANHQGNAGTVKPRSHTLQATATLRLMLEQTVDHMHHCTRTLETGEKIVSKCLPSSWRWKDSLPEINIVNAQFGLNKVESGTSHFQSILQRIEVIVLLAVGSVTNLRSFGQLAQDDRTQQIFEQGN